MRYHDATKLQVLLSSGAGPDRMLSKRGSAVIDARSNMLFIQDIPSKLEEIRAILTKIDVPTRRY